MRVYACVCALCCVVVRTHSVRAHGADARVARPPRCRVATTSAGLPLGEPITVLCSFYNGATTPLNVSMVMGSLNSPFVYDHFLKNVRSLTHGTSARGACDTQRVASPNLNRRCPGLT